MFFTDSNKLNTEPDNQTELWDVEAIQSFTGLKPTDL